MTSVAFTRNGATHSDTCLWGEPNAAPGGVEEYQLNPIWDVYIGLPDAAEGLCDPGYDKVIG